MKAIVQSRYGGADSLAIADVPRPDVGDDEVLVQVVAAGVDRGAVHLMTGRPYLMRLGTGLRAPRVTVPGLGFAGRVAAVGTNVTRFAPGDEVYGSGRRAYAELVAVPGSKVAPKPGELSFEEAASLPYASHAALEALRVHADVQPGERVLVVGASGAVGSIAVQLAKAFGAEVTGVCGPRSAEVARSAGADHVVDYTRGDFTEGPHRYDVIVDVFGRTPVRRLRHALTPHGRLVIVGGEGDAWTGGLHRQLGAMALSPFVGQQLRVFVAKEDAESLGVINELISAGKVVAPTVRSFPLANASEAVAALEAGRGSERVVLTM